MVLGAFLIEPHLLVDGDCCCWALGRVATASGFVSFYDGSGGMYVPRGTFEQQNYRVDLSINAYLPCLGRRPARILRVTVHRPKASNWRWSCGPTCCFELLR
jgi:hypothetical protein